MDTLVITLSPDGDVVGDYNIESYYENNKGKTTLNISNSLVLTRFRVGVKLKEIDPFRLVVIDVDGSKHEEMISKDGLFCEIWNTSILQLHLNLSCKMID